MQGGPRSLAQQELFGPIEVSVREDAAEGTDGEAVAEAAGETEFQIA